MNELSIYLSDILPNIKILCVFAAAFLIFTLCFISYYKKEVYKKGTNDGMSEEEFTKRYNKMFRTVFFFIIIFIILFLLIPSKEALVLIFGA